MLQIIFLLPLFMLNNAAVTPKELPKSFKLCKKNDPEFGRCLQQAVQDAFQKMKTSGIPALGVLPLEPLVINEIKINPGPGQPVNLKLHFSDIKMYGIPDTKLSDYDANIKDGKLKAIASTPKLWFEADYNADGKVLLLPLKGAGRCNITMFDLKTITELVFEPQKKDGETFWAIKDFKNKFIPKKMTMYFEGILRGERRLNSGINQFLNENWQGIFEELAPSFELAFGAVFKEITHRVFSKVPINKIFL